MNRRKFAPDIRFCILQENHSSIHNYEYSTLTVDTNAKNREKRQLLDKVINDSAAQGWKRVT